MSQAYIGYDLQNALREELRKKRRFRPHAGRHRSHSGTGGIRTIPLLRIPSKPIGHFMTKEQAEHAEKAYGYIMKEDAGRGYRRVVASPKPVEIVEQDAINSLVDANKIVICCGGGGDSRHSAGRSSQRSVRGNRQRFRQLSPGRKSWELIC